MASILCIHGVGQQLSGEETLAMEWRAALLDGLAHVHALPKKVIRPNKIAVVFYGDLFREQPAKGLSSPFVAADLDSCGIEVDLAKEWLNQINASSEINSDESSKFPRKSGWAHETSQRIVITLLRHKFFSGLSERFLIANLKQVNRYLTDPKIRAIIRTKLADRISAETKLVIAHSLGSIAAYETLATNAEYNLAFISLGSPLGIPNVIFNRLEPSPVNGRGIWPCGARSWTNIADRHDIVAAVKELAPLFGPKVRDVSVANEALAHDVRAYLTAPQTGAAVLEALGGS